MGLDLLTGRDWITRKWPLKTASNTKAIEGYEQLRRHALEHSRDEQGAPGLVVLMRLGMRAYMAALVESSAVVSVTPTTAMTDAKDGLMGELTRVMVAMALGAAEREIRI